MGIAKILKLVGLYKVNEGFTKPVDGKLEEAEANLDAVANVSDHSSQVIDALKAGDTARAVTVVLEFCKIITCSTR